MNILKRLFYSNKWEKKEYIGEHNLCYSKDGVAVPDSNIIVCVWLYKKKYTEEYKLMAIYDNINIYFDYELWKLNGKLHYTHNYKYRYN